MSVSRRDFLKAGLSSLAYFSTAATVPHWIARSAQALGATDDRVLVIVQQGGGNDGLNTVIPYTDPNYYGDIYRPNLRITEGLEPTTLDSLNALHPKLVRMKDWWDQGDMAIVQQVGYPNPTLSHFASTDHWERGSSPGSQIANTASGRKGWAARYFDNECGGTPLGQIDPLSMLGAGSSQLPFTLSGSDIYTPPAVSNPNSYQLQFPSDRVNADFRIRGYSDVIRNRVDVAQALPSSDMESDFLQRSYNLVQASVNDIETANALDPLVGGSPYPASRLGRGLDLASRIIRSGFNTKVFYVSQSGYDTHSSQSDPGSSGSLGRHADLLDEFDQALHAFLADMELSGNMENVLVVTFSEFGRRFKENGSRGTDHGTGNCLMTFGGPVRKGVYGGQPQLDEDTVNDNNGNVAHDIDFRSVYGRILRDWLGTDPVDIFGQDWETYQLQSGLDKAAFIRGEGEMFEDVNDDGVVNALDVQTVINASLGNATGTGADVNGDGAINAVDVQRVINETLGLEKDSADGIPSIVAKRAMARAQGA